MPKNEGGYSSPLLFCLPGRSGVAGGGGGWRHTFRGPEDGRSGARLRTSKNGWREGGGGGLWHVSKSAYSRSRYPFRAPVVAFLGLSRPFAPLSPGANRLSTAWLIPC